MTDWEKCWPSVKIKLDAECNKIIPSLVKDGFSSISTYEAVMNTLNWNLLLEGAVPSIPPSGRAQINEFVEKKVDYYRDLFKNPAA